MHSLKSIYYHVGSVVYLCQGFVAVGIGVDIDISTVRVNFLQEVAAVPNEAGLVLRSFPLKSCGNDVSETSSFFRRPLPILLPKAS